jgi:tetratricopeptide (TPR) repeat protein
LQPFQRTGHLYLPALLCAFVLLGPFQAKAQNEDTQFVQAVAAYNSNRFSQAKALFEQVKGSHSQEAKAYLGKITAYMSAMDEGEMMLGRPRDEQDSKSLDFAIGEFQEALNIKRDGPGNPAAAIQKARALKADLERTVPDLNARREMCEKAVAASEAHRYKEAKQFSCMLADQSPAFSCSGDEAVHMCQQMTDLAAMNPREPSRPPSAPASPSAAGTAVSSDSGALQRGKSSFDRNDFQNARTILGTVKGSDQVEANSYLEKMDLYEAAMKQAQLFSSQNKYNDARSAYQQAAQIKPDGPGNPALQASLSLLKKALDNFYSGAYLQAEEDLNAYLTERQEKSDLVHFYMGASKLGRYFLDGNTDETLHKDALSDLLIARKANFAATGRDISPRILKEYQQLSQ